MGYQTGILPALRDWGLTVVEVPGWQTRGSSSFDPRGFVAHHDVIGPLTRCPSIIIDGRSDLPGPLSQFWLERNGRVHLVAAGRANHAGEGNWNGLYGNSSVWGCEANNLGTPADPWPQAQLDAYYRLAAACADFSGFSPAYVCGHKEWAPSRKVDPHSINMADFRRKVADQRKDPRPLTDQQKRAVLAAARRLVRDNPRPLLRYRHPNLFTGRYVREVQATLGIPVTGRYGVGTFQAVKNMQDYLGLPITGEVNQATWVWIVYMAAVKAYEG